MSAALLRRGEWLAAIAGLALAAGLLRLSPGLVAPVVAAAVATLVAWIIWQDVKHFTISDAALLAMAALAFSFRWTLAMQVGEPKLAVVVAMAADVGLCGGLLFAFREIFYRLRGYDGLGFGDVKLAAAGALLVGTAGFAWALFAASAIGLVFVIARRTLASACPPIEKIAFGAVLAPALWTVWLVEQMPTALPIIGG